MPNNITNRIVKCSDKKLFKKLAVNSEQEVTFQKLIPMPSSLRLDECSSSVITEEQYENYKSLARKSKNPDEFIKAMGTMYPKISMYKDSLLRIFNKAHYGAETWYDWSIKNWGTKWDAYETDLCSLYFLTAWSTPESWWKALAQHMDFTAFFADEDTGSNCGIVIAKNKKIEIIYIDELSCGTVIAQNKKIDIVHIDELKSNGLARFFAELVYTGDYDSTIENISQYITEYADSSDDYMKQDVSLLEEILNNQKSLVDLIIRLSELTSKEFESYFGECYD